MDDTKENTDSVNSLFTSVSLFVTGTMSFFSIGYIFTCLSSIIPVLQTMYNESYVTRYETALSYDTWNGVLLPLTISFLVVGCMVGGVGHKYVLRIMSRKALMQLSHALNIISVLVLSIIGRLTLSYEAMIVGRFLSGVPIGIYYGLVPMMLAEMSSRKQQATWQSAAAIALSIGAVCGPVFAHPKVLGTYNLWPIMVAIAAIPSIIYLIASIWIPNSPFYIYRTYGRDQALLLLKKMRKGTKASLDEELDRMEAEMLQKEAIGIREMLTTKTYRNQFVAILALYANYVLTGIDNILLYATDIFVKAGMSSNNAAYAAIGVFGLQVIAGLFGSKFIDRFGALKVNIASSILIIISYILYTVSQATTHLYPASMPYVAIGGVALFMVAWSGGTNLATLVLLGELTIEPTRETAFSFGAVVLWIGSWLEGFLPPYLQDSFGPYSMMLWLGCTVVFVIYQVFFIPDTKGRTVEQIQAKFA